MLNLIAASAYFLLIHFGVAGTKLRDTLVARLGELGDGMLASFAFVDATRDETCSWALDAAAARMSAFGTKRTSRRAQSMSAFGGKADISGTLCNDVRPCPN